MPVLLKATENIRKTNLAVPEKKPKPKQKKSSSNLCGKLLFFTYNARSSGNFIWEICSCLVGQNLKITQNIKDVPFIAPMRIYVYLERFLTWKKLILYI